MMHGPINIRQKKFYYVSILFKLVDVQRNLLYRYYILYMCVCVQFFPHGATSFSGLGPPHYRGFTITPRHTTLGRTPLEEQPARRTDFYLTTHHTHKSQTSTTPVGFEPAIPASERPQTHALDREATGIGSTYMCVCMCIYIYRVSQEECARLRESVP